MKLRRRKKHIIDLRKASSAQIFMYLRAILELQKLNNKIEIKKIG